MIKFKRTNNIKLAVIAMIAVLLVVVSSSLTLAYFKFSKVYEGGSKLPALNFSYIYKRNEIETSKENALERIRYDGSTIQIHQISVSINTYGNNISGYFRAKISIIWEDVSLSNLFDGNKVCEVQYNNEIWEDRGDGYIYSKIALTPKEKEESLVLFSGVKFTRPNTTKYDNKNITLHIIADMHQNPFI